MDDHVDRAMEELWEWKRQAEEATRGMDRAALIEFCRTQADEVQRKLGLNLTSQSAADAARLRPRN